jgi:uncharacterized protein YbaP (TraB family)
MQVHMIMRWTSLILGWTLALAPCLPATAQPVPKADTAVQEQAAGTERSVLARPALWVVADEDSTIYLFGTIHILKPQIRWFEGPVRRAFDAADEIVLEVAEDEAGNMAMQAGLLQRAMDPAGAPLSSRLPAVTRAAYLAALERHGLPPQIFDQVKPWFAIFTLMAAPLKTLGYDPQSGADRVIARAAQAAGKPVTGLENAGEQIGFFEGMAEPVQVALLDQTIGELPTLGDTMARMIDVWSAGDPEGIAALMNESVEGNPEVERILLTDRNARWADWIRARLDRPGTVLVAVGAGHLAGPGSVQAMLAQRGIATRRIAQAD